jgi:hypothetical protein
MTLLTRNCSVHIFSEGETIKTVINLPPARLNFWPKQLVNGMECLESSMESLAISGQWPLPAPGIVPSWQYSNEQSNDSFRAVRCRHDPGAEQFINMGVTSSANWTLKLASMIRGIHVVCQWIESQHACLALFPLLIFLLWGASKQFLDGWTMCNHMQAAIVSMWLYINIHHSHSFTNEHIITPSARRPKHEDSDGRGLLP